MTGLVLAIALMTGQQDGVLLRLKGEPGDRAVYETHLTTSERSHLGFQTRVELVSTDERTLTWKVTARTGRQWTVTGDDRAVIAGITGLYPDEGPGPPVLRDLTPGAVQFPVKAVKPGDRWSPNKDDGLRSLDTVYELAAIEEVEGVLCARIRIYTEVLPVTVWIETETGWLYKSEGDTDIGFGRSAKLVTTRMKPVLLRLRAEAGDKLVYMVSTTLGFSGLVPTEGEERETRRSEINVTAVKNGRISALVQEPFPGAESVWSVVWDERGRALSAEVVGEEDFGVPPGLLNPSMLVFPEEPLLIGDRWTQELDHMGLEMKFALTVLGFETVDGVECMKIDSVMSMSILEDMGMRSTHWIELSNGWLLMGESQMTGPDGLMDMHMTVRRVKT